MGCNNFSEEILELYRVRDNLQDPVQALHSIDSNVIALLYLRVVWGLSLKERKSQTNMRVVATRRTEGSLKPKKQQVYRGLTVIIIKCMCMSLTVHDNSSSV